MKYQAFVFDFDGVLADSVEVKTCAFEQLYRPHGPEVAAEVIRYHRENGGTPRRKKFEYYEAKLLGTPADSARLKELNDLFSSLVVDKVVEAAEVPGATDFLRHWYGKLPLFVDSASPDNELIEIIKRRGLSAFFQAAYGSDRSKTDNLAAIIAAEGFNPTQVLFFGDALGDLKAARACGADFMGILSAENSPLSQIADIECFHDFHEIQKELDKVT